MDFRFITAFPRDISKRIFKKYIMLKEQKRAEEVCFDNKMD